MIKNFEILTLLVSRPQTRPLTPNFLSDILSNHYKLYTDDIRRSQVEKQKFENFDPFRGPEPKLGPRIKIFHQISYRGLKSYTQYAFRKPTLKKKNFRIFKIFGSPPQKIRGPNQNSVSYRFQALVRTAHHEKMNVLARKLQEEIEKNPNFGRFFDLDL